MIYSEKMKQLLWIGTSYKVVGNWPKAVKQAAGYQLHLLQQGFEPDDWKPMKIIGSGVREVRLHTEGEYRVPLHSQVRRRCLCFACF